jgi:MFS transporter, PAT family, beta-lactamase induction signal transducer AmpG
VTGLALLPVLRTREPPAPPRERASWRVYAGFLRQRGAGLWLLTLAIYKFGEAFGMGMLRPLLVDRGLSLADLGWITGTAGFIAGLVGALVGGAMVGAFGRYRMLLIFGAVQALAVASCITLVHGPLDLLHVYMVCTFEHLSSGMATVALFTMMMDTTRPHAAGSDYTLQACVVVFATIMASAGGGFSAARYGYADHFALAAGLCLLGLVPVLLHRARASKLS